MQVLASLASLPSHVPGQTRLQLLRIGRRHLHRAEPRVHTSIVLFGCGLWAPFSLTQQKPASQSRPRAFGMEEADVYHLMHSMAFQSSRARAFTIFFALAVNRGHVSVSGSVGTLQHQHDYHLWSFQHGRFLSAKGRLCILEGDSSDLDLRGLSERNLFLAGNTMSLAQL